MATGQGKRTGDKADNVVTTADVAPLTGAGVQAQPKRLKPFMSEGMRHDLESSGSAVDPVSGARYTLDRASGVVTVTEADRIDPNTGETIKGEVTTLDDVVINTPAVETTIDPDTGETLTIDPETGVVTASNPTTGETRIVED